MHSLNKDKFRYYAKILMVVSFTFIIYGSVLLYYNRVNYLDPINDYYATDDDDNIIINFRYYSLNKAIKKISIGFKTNI